MIYTYECKYTGERYEVIKPVNRLEIEERCPCCWSNMKRIVCFSGRMSMGTFKPGYHHAFGKTFTNKAQLDNEIKSIRDTTGVELHEVGNDTGGFSKPDPIEPDIKSAVKEFRDKCRN